VAPKLILGRYLVNDADVLGTGGYCIVRRGVDQKTGAAVAVKTFSDHIVEQNPEQAARKFAHEISVFRALGLFVGEQVSAEHKNLGRSCRAQLKAHPSRSFQMQSGADAGSLLLLGTCARPRELFANLIDYSRDEKGNPGRCPEDGKCWVVVELADRTLEQDMAARSKARQPYTTEEIREIVGAMVQMLAWLHSYGMVHLDIKPSNVMWFGDRWKLIDMDGCQPTGREVVLDGFFTPLYVAPELATSVVAGVERVRLSRSMDVWAFGVTMLDAIMQRAALEEYHSQFAYASLFDEGDENDWYRWVADTGAIQFKEVGVPDDLDADLRGLLAATLCKNSEERITVPGLLLHPFIFQSPKEEAAKTAPPSPARATAVKSLGPVGSIASQVFRSLGQGSDEVLQYQRVLNFVVEVCDWVARRSGFPVVFELDNIEPGVATSEEEFLAEIDGLRELYGDRIMVKALESVMERGR